ncbi:FKBP-type peptidyl-prolyl cis-trans isomerase [Thauera linaloolentis]|uniref:Peptidyl-prolyl cis-trans isomerase n=1 Tax=Thauera linaloolentis (strain DSM 12138 / JCM 21573 / CCUG 41526 / CIP 105981 / IAM 15112 / NBRC 102519 / 47Lol) TaxID=1123367 RepID=N6YBP7_THAL4|nr:FKBP-type peptidyl-prolyl cis-trans isomerase [Thauera linaloolentis]ENO88905.1 FKBP-type peptidylprolyl isomerase [Thauera linaloolentis 47Lol = DSM 12138]MCM8564800.1 FKBP-type peptidyl-prolyl cis-trans isomerase [Thauera linaloolentis]
MNQIVEANSLVTLHYRISLPGGQPLISTFNATPATLQLGAGEMLPAMEQLMVGLVPGTRHVFELEAEQAFGPHRTELIERVKREHMPDEEIEAMSIMEFTAPDGSRYSGLVREIDEQSALIDFNHPLAGKSIHFEVEVIGVS